MNVLSEEMKRALTSRGMRIALLLGISLLIICYPLLTALDRPVNHH